MNKTLKVLLLTDLVVRFIGLAGFTIFIGAVYDSTGRASNVGLVSLATALPSLFVLAYANRCTKRFSALGLLRGVTVFRLASFAVLAATPESPLMIMAAAGLQSLSHQISVSTKMTLDAQFLDDAVRRRYLSRKAMLANVAIVCAPAAGGLLVGGLGYKLALVAMSVASAVLLLLVMLLRASPVESACASESSPGLRASLRGLFAARHVAAVVGVYCAMAAVLEIQAPLVFPFVHEIYGSGSQLAGTLLGLCGLAGLAGAFCIERWPKLFSPSSIPVLVCLDGFLFLCFTQISNLTAACLLFTTLGAMGSVTLIVVESVVQTGVNADNRPFVFSLMQFSGGAGGASLGVLAAFLAERFTTKLVLSGAALLEVGVGALCIVLLGGALKAAQLTVSGRE